MRHSVLVLLVLLVFLAVSLTAPLLAGVDPPCVEETQELNMGPYYDPEGLTESGCSTEQPSFGPYCDPEGQTEHSPVEKTQELNHGSYDDPEG